MATQELDLQQFLNDPEKFAKACGYMISPSFSLEQLKECLANDPSLAAATGEHGSAAYYAADRDGDEDFVSVVSFLGFSFYSAMFTETDHHKISTLLMSLLCSTVAISYFDD